MKLQVIIPLWKRPHITKICFDNLKKLISEIEHEVSVLCIISEPEYIMMCNEYGFNWVFAANDPLGKKLNTGIRYALDKYKFDYLMTMNSDSVIDSKLFKKYYDDLFFKKDFFGVSRVTFINSKTWDAVDYNYGLSILGVGKCIKRELVKKAFDELGQLYRPDANRGLDDGMFDNLIKVKASPYIVEYEGQLVYDVKSDVNIHPFEKFEKRGLKVEPCFKAA